MLVEIVEGNVIPALVIKPTIETLDKAEVHNPDDVDYGESFASCVRALIGVWHLFFATNPTGMLV